MADGTADIAQLEPASSKGFICSESGVEAAHLLYSLLPDLRSNPIRRNQIGQYFLHFDTAVQRDLPCKLCKSRNRMADDGDVNNGGSPNVEISRIQEFNAYVSTTLTICRQKCGSSNQMKGECTGLDADLLVNVLAYLRQDQLFEVMS